VVSIVPAGGGGVAGIVVAVLLSVLVVAALVIAFAIFVIMHGRRKGDLLMQLRLSFHHNNVTNTFMESKVTD
jgi:hypothetical protein